MYLSAGYLLLCRKLMEITVDKALSKVNKQNTRSSWRFVKAIKIGTLNSQLRCLSDNFELVSTLNLLLATNLQCLTF